MESSNSSHDEAVASRKMTTAQRIHHFLESPQTRMAFAVQAVIMTLVGISIANVIIEFVHPEVFQRYRFWFDVAEYVILCVLTVEYLLRLSTAKRKIRWARQPMNVIDFIAIAPSYIELLIPLLHAPSSQAVRLIRLARLFRVFRVFRYQGFFRAAFGYKNTVLETMTPVIGMFVALKATVWMFESSGWWAPPTSSLDELFALVGFSLGIILSQKIGVTYDKFLRVEEASIRLYGTLKSLELILEGVETGLSKACRDWAKEFLQLLTDPVSDNHLIAGPNAKLYLAMARAEKQPAEMAVMHGDIARDAAFCLSKKVRVTPKAYDALLHQATILYLALLAIFITGWPGMVSVVVATYTLYGMYTLTRDFDSVLGGEHNLINIDISELESFANGETASAIRESAAAPDADG
ncbi:MAG: ion transporter [Planctomycetota bacterium]